MPQDSEITALLDYYKARDAKLDEINNIKETLLKSLLAQQAQQAAVQNMGPSLYSFGKTLGSIIKGGKAEKEKFLEKNQRANDLQRARIERESGPGSAGGYEMGHSPEENPADWLSKMQLLGEAGVNLYLQGKAYINAAKTLKGNSAQQATAEVTTTTQSDPTKQIDLYTTDHIDLDTLAKWQQWQALHPASSELENIILLLKALQLNATAQLINAAVKKLGGRLKLIPKTI